MSVNDLINYSFGAMLYVCFPLRRGEESENKFPAVNGVNSVKWIRVKETNSNLCHICFCGHLIYSVSLTLFECSPTFPT